MHIQCGTTAMTEADVPEIAQCLSTENPKTKMAGFEKEFQVMSQKTFTAVFFPGQNTWVSLNI